MTAKEMLNKRKFNPDEPIHLSESEVEDLMNEFARHIAEQAVGEIKMKGLPDKPISYYRIHELACDRILTRIKQLTQGELTQTNEDK